jgi:hypothetical protein
LSGTRLARVVNHYSNNVFEVVWKEDGRMKGLMIFPGDHYQVISKASIYFDLLYVWYWRVGILLIIASFISAVVSNWHEGCRKEELNRGYIYDSLSLNYKCNNLFMVILFYLYVIVYLCLNI